MTIKEVLRKNLAKYLYRNAYSRAFFSLYGIVIKEIRVAFSQFYTFKYPFTSFIRVLGVMGSSLIRILLGRSLKYSYSFTGEDLILNNLYSPLVDYNGFYVEVGCNHPIFLSNTFIFYRKGWRGICIDAHPKMIKKWTYLRPRDRAVLALVSDTPKDRNFYIIENDVLSTTEDMHLEAFEKENLSYEMRHYKPQTLTSILDELNAPQEIDILSIDAEGHDFNVLKSLDFNKYKPQWIILEDDFEIKSPESSPIYNFMVVKGYELVGFVLKNVYFKRT